MIEILMNPITISVVAMCVLCLLKINVMLSLVVASIIGGLMGGMGLSDVFSTFVGGMGGNAETALSYVFLGTFAAALAHCGIADILSVKISAIIKGKKLRVLIVFIVCAAISGTLIPVHIAFIPILVPPMLVMMNKMKLDRRQAACSLAFGLKAPYITLPIGYGLIFHGLIAGQMSDNGLATETSDVWTVTWILGIGMIVGLVLSILYYKKDRDYSDLQVASEEGAVQNTSLNSTHIVALVAIAVTLAVQLYFGSMPMGAIAGLLTMIIGGAVKLKDVDTVFNEGIKLMGLIAFVMLVASGYATVIQSAGAVESLVGSAVEVLGENKLIAAIVMILVGLLTTMGIGTSFGTVPVLAVLYVPMGLQLGFSQGAIIVLIAAAAALGDAGSPASDTTLGPTAGLNADGQHNHIWDTCVPTFIFYNIPLVICGVIGAMIF